MDIKDYFNSDKITDVRFFDFDNIIFDDRTRDWCKENLCSKYSTCWTCPPGAGSLDVIKGNLKQYDSAVLFSVAGHVNSREDIDSALKCFVFFLISQPLVYLIQVPFNTYGWGIFTYYRYWFIWTLLCFPMGYIGYYMKKGKWWGYLILLPMIVLTGYSYQTYFSDFLFNIPRYILICLFCACMMIMYPVMIFEDRNIKTVGAVIGGIAVITLTVIGLMNPPVYSTEILVNSEDHVFDDTYQVTLADETYGNVKIIYIDSVEDYFVHADLKKAGKTVLVLESPSGEKKEFDLSIEKDTYEITQK